MAETVRLQEGGACLYDLESSGMHSRRGRMWRKAMRARWIQVSTSRKVPSFEPCMLSLPSNELCTLAGLLIFSEHTHRTHSTTEIANGGQVSKPSSFAAHRAVSLRIYAIQPSMWFNSDVNDKEAHHLYEDFEALTSQLVPSTAC